ncbi:MAG: hypothetical protein OXQ90_06900 [Gammaproteobacteria bacterium]|nr:hypothetical protein [Gammaproteobacteria bacterium]
MLGSAAWRSLKEAMDLWCACWFWPVDEIACAPLPTTLASPTADTRRVAAQVAAEIRFFHWELEFPDVFRESGSGFHAILGNPPWDIAKPNSVEFFSGIDPLYRSYGKQEAVRKQSAYFDDADVEHDWLDYNARFRGQSNFTSYAAAPYGDPDDTDKSQDRFSLSRGYENKELHARWRRARRRTAGFGDPEHPFRRQGSADLNLYKLFLEAAHTLLKPVGRLGFVVPSGLYSDNGTGALRRLFLDHCRWEWLFGIENRDKIFPIHRSYKFNPVVVEKGGATDAIRTAFMRRSLDDWERADELATAYTRAQVERFSPRSRAILEIQSQRDLEILEKIYANSVLLGDQGPDGWGIRYATEFHMTNDSHLFPPRPQWEAKGYRPDEYSRWLLGDWRPIEELWEEMGIDPSKPQPAEIELEDWLFDTTAGPERRQAEAQFIHGHLLKPGDIARTNWQLRCAQPPYDRLPIPRADIPSGVILSREADSWIREHDISDVALPLYQGLMFNDRLPNVAQHISGSGRRAKWNKGFDLSSHIQPQFLIAAQEYRTNEKVTHYGTKIGIRSLARATDNRTAIAGVISGLPSGNSVSYLTPESVLLRQSWFLILSSFSFDWQARMRVSGTNMNYHFFEEMGVPTPRKSSVVCHSRQLFLGLAVVPQAVTQVEWSALQVPLSDSERLRCNSIADALVASLFGLNSNDMSHILRSCELEEPQGQPTEFWRVDKDKVPELRHTILTQIAFRDLEKRINRAGDWQTGVREFLDQNNGDGWLLPETARLSDYGLGDDDRAEQPQLVATRLGVRYLDWQLAQAAEEAVRECHLHARNLLGGDGYVRLIAGLIEDRALDGRDASALINAPQTRQVLGDDGQVTVLVEVRGRRILDDDAYWIAAGALRDGSHETTDRYGTLLDQLHARGLLDDAGYRRRRGIEPPAAGNEPHLQVAEQGAAYRADTPGRDWRGELFE